MWVNCYIIPVSSGGCIKHLVKKTGEGIKITKGEVDASKGLQGRGKLFWRFKNCEDVWRNDVDLTIKRVFKK